MKIFLVRDYEADYCKAFLDEVNAEKKKDELNKEYRHKNGYDFDVFSVEEIEVEDAPSQIESSFDFLSKEPDIYSSNDGEPINQIERI